MKVIKEFYNEFNYPRPNTFGLLKNLAIPYGPLNTVRKRILVIGCGTIEAFLKVCDNKILFEVYK